MKYSGPDLQLINLDRAPLGFGELHSLLSAKSHIRFDRDCNTVFVGHVCERQHWLMVKAVDSTLQSSVLFMALPRARWEILHKAIVLQFRICVNQKMMLFA